MLHISKPVSKQISNLSTTMLPPLLMWVLGLLCAGSQPVQSSVEGSDVTALRQKVLQMEDLFTEQRLLFRQLVERLQYQESVNRDQQALLQQMQDRLSHQETVNREQGARLSLQDSILLKQDALLSNQDGLLAQQKTTLDKLESEKTRCAAELSGVQMKLNFLEMTVNAGDVTTGDITTQQGQSKSPAVSNVRVRSDDSGPLEAVVTQLSQKLTEVSADIQAIDSEVQTLKNTDVQQNNDIMDARTSTFIRWGSSRCPNSSQLVYSGVVGGSPYDETGAATNYLCLTMSPVPGQITWSGARLSGAEYEVTGSHHNKDTVCSVCRSSLSTTIMIPGTNVCTAGWQLQYSGYLMAGYYGHAAGSEFICVDSAMESRPGTADNHDGKLLYAARAVCGSLPCEPYVSDAGVTCAVCSK